MRIAKPSPYDKELRDLLQWANELLDLGEFESGAKVEVDDWKDKFGRLEWRLKRSEG